MSPLPVTALVVAKAPVAGVAKTRLAATIGDRAAADVAAAALLDTLDAVAAVPVSARVVALTGELDAASGSEEIRSRLTDFIVVPQRGVDFADRLAHAHADASEAAGLGTVLQIGMDTPQVNPDLLTRCAAKLLTAPAVLGMAHDGGWWVLGVRSASAATVLRTVPMSRADTGELTLRALRDGGWDAELVDELRDVDTAEDIAAVREACAPGSRFAQVTRMVGC